MPTKNKKTVKINMPERTSRSQLLWMKKHIRIILIILAAIVLIVEVLPVGRNLVFYSTWIICSSKPVSTDTDWHLSSSVRYYSESPAYPTFRLYAKFYCTPHDAEVNGYSANPNTYSFPNLTHDEWEKMYDESF